MGQRTRYPKQVAEAYGAEVFRGEPLEAPRSRPKARRVLDRAASGAVRAIRQ